MPLGRVDPPREEILALINLLRRAALGHDFLSPRRVTSMGSGNDQDQMGHRCGISGSMCHTDHSAVTRSNANDRAQAQILAQSFHVFYVLVERVLPRVATGRAALTAV